MKSCRYCGNQMRDDCAFCPACGMAYEKGAKADYSADTVPLITLSPASGSLSSKRVLGVLKSVAAVVVVVAVALGGVLLWTYIGADPFAASTINTVEDDTYRQCLSLVNDVRNDNFNNIVGELITGNNAENYDFFKEYETLYNNIIPDSSPEEAVMFRDCCFMVSYTEFNAKKYEYYANSGIFGLLYRKSADEYRNHADTLYQWLTKAETQEDLQQIIDYCEENNIIKLK